MLFIISKELSQQVHKLMNVMVDSSSTQKRVKVTKSTEDRVKDDDLKSLFKKTQSKISSIENEIKRVEAKNLHQD